MSCFDKFAPQFAWERVYIRFQPYGDYDRYNFEMRYEPGLISILVPTRNRPANVLRLLESIRTTSKNSHLIEVLFYVDVDDDSFPNEVSGITTRVIKGPTMWLSLAVNTLFVHSSGEILMPGADDMIFQTVGWDDQIRSSFQLSEDKIKIVYANEVGWYGEKIAMHGFIHRKWIETVGACVAPGRLAAYDRWVTDVGRILDRLEYRADIEIPHLHYRQGEGLAPFDETYRRVNSDRRSFQSLITYKKLERERRIDRILLAEVMNPKPKWEGSYFIGELIASKLKPDTNLKNLDARRLRSLKNYQAILLIAKHLFLAPLKKLRS